MSTTIPQAFDAHAEGYDRSLEPLLPIKALLHQLIRSQLEDLPASASVLVAGAGTGAEARFLASLFPGWRFTLVDLSAGMLGVAQRHAVAEGFADRCTFHVGTVASLPSDGFDAATSVLVSHFLPDAGERRAYFAEIAKRLVPGAPLFTADLCAELDAPCFGALMDLWQALARVPEDRRGPFRAAFGTAIAAHGPREVEVMIRDAGFSAPAQVFQAALVRGWTARRE